MLGPKQERINEAKKKQEEAKKLEELPIQQTQGPRQVSGTGGKDVDKKPEDIILEKTEKHPQLTFKQKVEAFRNRRRRKNIQQIGQVKMPETTTKCEEEKPNGKEKPKEEVKPTIQTIAYRCKDCKEIFTGDSQMDICISCNSKNIEKLPEYIPKEKEWVGGPIQEVPDDVVCEECAKEDCEIRGQGNKRMPCSDYIKKKASK